MQVTYKELSFSAPHPLADKLFTDKTACFDIETTGFSPQNTSLYLIGCAVRKQNRICIHQFFADTAAEEKNILEAFLELLSACDTVVTYNGARFDIPYLKSKCAQLLLNDPFDFLRSVDIYREIYPFQHLLKLTDCRQKTVEAFLGISREDPYNGGELIEIYQNYVAQPKKEWLALLLKHNYEDVSAMPRLASMLAYPSLFHGQIRVTEAKINESRSFEGDAIKELFLKLALKAPLPTTFSCRANEIYLSAGDTSASLAVRLTDGEMKYFYKDYRDYYYLPEEDIAIHKSVAVYTPKAHRQPAKASNCYAKKSGSFLPQYNSSLITPEFFSAYRDKNSYFLCEEALCENLPLLTRYAKLLLKQCSASAASKRHN